MSRAGQVARRRLALLGVALLLVTPALAGTAEELLAADHVIVRARVEPAVVYVGQPAALEVDVLTRTWFLKAPQYPDTLEVADAIVLPPETFGVNFTERIDGETYAGQTRSFTLFPTRTGRIDLPSLPVTLAVADADARRTPDFTLHTPPLTVEAELPAAARGLGLVVATPALSLRESWEPAPGTLKVGDSIRRTVTTGIEESVAMLLPGVELAAPDGVAAYPDRPVFEDSRARGRMSGRRVDSATFLFERSGTFVLPEIVVHWWDLEAGSLRRETLPAVEVVVEENPDAALPVFAAEQEEPADLPASGSMGGVVLRYALAAVLLIAIAAAVWRAASGRRRQAGEQGPRIPSEAELFARLERVAREGDAQRTLAACYAWMDRWSGISTGATLFDLADLARDEILAGQLRELSSAAVGAAGFGSPERLLERLRNVRRRRARSRRSRRGLPGLNPDPKAEHLVSSSR